MENRSPWRCPSARCRKGCRQAEAGCEFVAGGEAANTSPTGTTVFAAPIPSKAVSPGDALGVRKSAPAWAMASRPASRTLVSTGSRRLSSHAMSLADATQGAGQRMRPERCGCATPLLSSEIASTALPLAATINASLADATPRAGATTPVGRRRRQRMLGSWRPPGPPGAGSGCYAHRRWERVLRPSSVGASATPLADAMRHVPTWRPCGGGR